MIVPTIRTPETNLCHAAQMATRHHLRHRTVASRASALHHGNSLS